MQVERVNTKDLVVNSMPDGSRVIRNSNNETVFALNATAAAAWDACSSATTIAGVAEEMRRSFDPNVTDELAESCILQFQKKKLVKVSGGAPKATRRAVLAGLGAVALPLVVSLTVGEQKAHAQHADSVDYRLRAPMSPKRTSATSKECVCRAANVYRRNKVVDRFQSFPGSVERRSLPGVRSALKQARAKMAANQGRHFRVCVIYPSSQ